MFPILQVGRLAVQVPGLVLLAGLWIGLSLTEKHAGKHRLNPETLYNLVFTALIAGVLGARLAYAGRFPAAFMESPASLVSLNPGLLDPVGGLVFAALGALIYGQRKSIPLLPALDALVPLFGTAAIAFALANLASGTGFGSATSLPWGVELWGDVRHPSQVYEAAAALFILVLIWPLVVKPAGRPPGYAFFQFLVWTAGAKLVLEAFRGDSHTIFYGLRSAQLAAWVIMAYGIYAIGRLSSSGKQAK